MGYHSPSRRVTVVIAGYQSGLLVGMILASCRRGRNGVFLSGRGSRESAWGSNGRRGARGQRGTPPQIIRRGLLRMTVGMDSSGRQWGWTRDDGTGARLCAPTGRRKGGLTRGSAPTGRVRSPPHSNHLPPREKGRERAHVGALVRHGRGGGRTRRSAPTCGERADGGASVRMGRGGGRTRRSAPTCGEKVGCVVNGGLL